MLLDTPEAVLETHDKFRLGRGGPDAISTYFRDHGVAPDGVVRYARLMAIGALEGSLSGELPLTPEVLMALFSGGVALGLHLADELRKAEAA